MLVVAAAATFTPRPFEAAATGFGAVCGVLVAVGSGDAVAGVAGAGLPLLALLILKTIKQTLDEGTAARRAARPRRRRPEQAVARRGDSEWDRWVA